MDSIIRNPESASKRTFDVIIIGGGIYGVMLAYEASKRDLRTLILEKNDFGSGTSFNSLRILHGGFRYLQTMDLHRFYESVLERKWFLKNFPGLVEPLPCLMPLYGNGLRRPSFLRVAASMNDILSFRRNEGVGGENHLPGSKVIGLEETKRLFPDVDAEGLKGGVVWYDAVMPDSQLILMKILKKAGEHNCICLNYVEAKHIIVENNNVNGVVALDRETDRLYEYKSTIIINAGGPWCREIAANFDKDIPELFFGSLAWNVLLDIKALSTHALAITPKKQQARTYFLLPWKGKIIAGTGHAPWYGEHDNPVPSRALLIDFLNDLNLAIPKLQVGVNNILHVFSGLLPAKGVGSIELTKREVIYDHSKNGGIEGLFSVSGIKFTTARRVAQKVLDRIFPERKSELVGGHKDFNCSKNGYNKDTGYDYRRRLEPENNAWKNAISEIIKKEAVVHFDDLIFRRSTLWEDRQGSIDLITRYAPLFLADKVEYLSEIERLKKAMSLNMINE